MFFEMISSSISGSCASNSVSSRDSEDISCLNSSGKVPVTKFPYDNDNSSYRALILDSKSLIFPLCSSSYAILSSFYFITLLSLSFALLSRKTSILEVSSYVCMLLRQRLRSSVDYLNVLSRASTFILSLAFYVSRISF